MDKLTVIDNATRMLTEAKDLNDLQQIRGIAAMATEYARAAKLGLEAQNVAAEIKLRAERKAGELLAELKREQGERNDLTLSNVGQSSDYATALTESNTTRQDAGRWQKIATIPEQEFEAAISTATDNEKELTTQYMIGVANGKTAHVSHNSGENEWYTPHQYIEAARRVMGSIDTDPASSEIANRTVQAETFYTKEDDGLTKEWRGNVWLNPPYAQPLINDFSLGVVSRMESREFDQCIVLVNNATETNWLHRMLVNCNAVCFTRKRIKFIDVNGNATGQPLQGQCILYFGNNKQKFYEVFYNFGVVFNGR